MTYAIINSEGKCINRVVWDGVTPWEPPAGCTAVYDPDNQHPIYIEPQLIPEEAPDPLSTLTPEQKQALINLLQESN